MITVRVILKEKQNFCCNDPKLCFMNFLHEKSTIFNFFILKEIKSEIVKQILFY